MSSINSIDEQVLALVSQCQPSLATPLIRQLVGRLGADVVTAALQTAVAESGTASVEDTPVFRQIGDFLHFVGETPLPLVDKLLPEKSLVLVTGKPKAGKSFLALDIADAVSRGVPVFGVFTVNRPGAVGYVGMEDGANEIANRLMYRGFKPDDTQQPFFVCAQRFKITDTRNLDALRRMVEAFHPVLLVVDTAREALSIRDWNAASEVSEAMRPLREFARQYCTVVLVAHNRKGVSEDSGDEISGSNAFTSSVDGWISAGKVEVIEETGNRRLHLSIVGRGGMEGRPVVEMDTTNTRFRLVPADELGGDAAAHDRAAKQRRWAPYLEALGNMAEQTGTINAITDATHANRRTVERVVKEMLDAGEITQAESSVVDGNGRPAKQYTRNPF